MFDFIPVHHIAALSSLTDAYIRLAPALELAAAAAWSHRIAANKLAAAQSTEDETKTRVCELAVSLSSVRELTLKQALRAAMSALLEELRRPQSAWSDRTVRQINIIASVDLLMAAFTFQHVGHRYTPAHRGYSLEGEYSTALSTIRAIPSLPAITDDLEWSFLSECIDTALKSQTPFRPNVSKPQLPMVFAVGNRLRDCGWQAGLEQHINGGYAVAKCFTFTVAPPANFLLYLGRRT